MEDIKKILIVSAALHIGGAEKVARDIGYFADTKPFLMHYLVFGSEVKAYEPELEERGYKIIHIDAPQAGYYRFIKTLRRLIKNNNYSVVHAHTMFNIGLVMYAAWKEKTPIRIAHAHSALNDGSGLVKMAYEFVMRRMILRYSTDLIACGEAAGNRLFGKKAFSKKGKLILNGIQTDEFGFNCFARNRIREELRIQNAFVIGHVGRFETVKNQRFLIKILPEVIKHKSNAMLLLLGDGGTRAEIEQLVVDMKLTDHVIMTGNVRNVSDYLSAMDVFAFPSLYEGMPLSIVEVQANGLPCILSTGVPKDVYLTDLIIPVSLDEPDKWIETICSVERHEPEKYVDLLKKAGFDLMDVLKEFYDIYERAE